MESVFDYRYYTVHELIDILTRKNIYFSRRNSYAAIAREAPTVIRILKDSSDIANYPSGDIVVAASCYSNCENISLRFCNLTDITRNFLRLMDGIRNGICRSTVV